MTVGAVEYAVESMQEGKGPNPCGKILFGKNTENALKKNNSPRFTAFTAKRCKKYSVKKFFSPHFTAFLTKIHHQTSIHEMNIKKRTKISPVHFRVFEWSKGGAEVK